jgi:predicted RNase H-like nuclease (RuvC/YqgF family)
MLPILSFSQGITKEDFEKEIKPLKENLKSLQKENLSLKNEINLLKNADIKLNNQLNKVDGQTRDVANNLNSSKTELDSKIDETNLINTNKIQAVDQSLSKTSLWAIIGGLIVLILIIVIYLVITTRQKSDKTGIIDHLSKSISSIEDNLVKEFGKQTILLEAQMEVLGRQKIEIAQNSISEPDHSLALKVASEINLIERNINLMDSKTKGLKQLQASVGKLKDNLSANGYEMPELLGKQFHQGLKVIVTSSIPDENLENGQEIISKILIPAVLYNDKMVQTAQIEVSVGY